MLVSERDQLRKNVESWVEQYGSNRSALIPVLQEVQRVHGHISEYVMQVVADILDILKHKFSDWKWLEGATLKIAIAHGTANAKKVMDDIRSGGPCSECHFIEFMACPGGCLGGGGQPIPTNEKIREARAKAIYSEDAEYKIRKSHENPAVLKIYGDFLTDGPCGHRSHKLLHTEYMPRGKYIV